MGQTGQDSLDPHPGRPAHPAAGAPHPYVLVVDDDPIINELVRAYVGLTGQTARGVLTGSDAIATFREQTPAMIILDLMLPDLSGFDVCRKIRSDPAGRDVPIVMLTAMPDDESRRQGIAVGATDYLTKPFDPDRLLEMIGRVRTTGPA